MPRPMMGFAALLGGTLLFTSAAVTQNSGAMRATAPEK